LCRCVLWKASKQKLVRLVADFVSVFGSKLFWILFQY